MGDGMKKLVVGILAHVDAGKTTLSEGLLYRSGRLKALGRVDHGSAFLDTDAQERERGITIFSKQAVLPLDDLEVTLLDTPGHVDFSTEMERTLQVLDYAILVISGTDGVAPAPGQRRPPRHKAPPGSTNRPRGRTGARNLGCRPPRRCVFHSARPR